MPELPEVQTIATQLNKVLRGSVFSSVSILRDKSAQSDLSFLVGKKVGRVSRLAKQIMFEFKKEEGVLLIHLKMTGQLIYQSKKNTERVVGGHPTKDWVEKLPSSHTRIVAEFSDGSSLYFNDQRVFGWWKIVLKNELKKIIDKLPPDVVDSKFDTGYLSGVFSKSGRAIKLVILDQQKMGGMGNIYANDALWMARIDPRKPANKLKKIEISKLRKEMVKVLGEGIELGGASISDYVHVSGVGGGYQDVMRVYEKAGEVCGRSGCGGVIEKVRLGGRGTYFCPVCQA
ncbi:bifunctional DNA-formamidopyrimidine glycosylase/DNA-(apurinic or apyrimidinic site) lyase [Patescibacteria group bacterium]